MTALGYNAIDIQGVNQLTFGLVFDNATYTAQTGTPAFRIRNANNNAAGAGGITFDSTTNTITWKAIPNANFRVLAFADPTDTDPANAVAYADVPGVATLIGGINTDAGAVLFPGGGVGVTGTGNTLGSNNTQNVDITFDLTRLQPTLPGTYTIRIQALPMQQNVVSQTSPVLQSAISGRSGLYWGVPSMASQEFITLGPFYSITANAQVPGGTLVPSATAALPGTTIHLTPTPDTDWYFAAGSVISTPNGLVDQSTLSFVMPAEDVEVSATFMQLPAGAYAIVIDPTATAHGTIVPSVQRAETNPQPPTGTPPSPWYAFPGDTVTLTVTPDTGWRYVVDSILVNGTIPVSAPDYSFTMPDATATITAIFEQIPAPPPAGGGGGGGSWIRPPAPEPEPELVPAGDIPHETITPTVPSEDIQEAADDAVYALAQDAADRRGAAISSVGPALEVDLPEEVPTIVTLVDLPDDLDTARLTTMAVLNPDGTLTPIPTKIDADGNVVVFLTKDAVLVPLDVWASFNDIDHLSTRVRDEILRAIGLMIIEGFGDGTFRPTDQVTTRQAVTMFLRATGIPVSYTTAMTTGAAHDFIPGGLDGATPMTRIATAELIVAALAHFGIGYELTADDVDTLLAPFGDLDGLTETQRTALAVTVLLEIFQGFGDETMRPADVLTRSQMASLAVRMQDVMLTQPA
ncbi:MAG: S-layer homology domain-containing protein [Oscillospiraceae bacterium]|nr:S-layer homology domain-containing protein [Oscillospiraceae bacterium]